MFLCVRNSCSKKRRVQPGIERHIRGQGRKVHPAVRVTYREGSVIPSGIRDEGPGAQGRAGMGEGYFELTGYAGSVEF
ncbi:MAG: hypothetical protein ABSC04_11700 [Syntrophobacteraceae bacterium]|jgi:hypothetical protein